MGRRCIGRRAREGEERGKDELMSPRRLRVGVGPADLLHQHHPCKHLRFLSVSVGTHPGRKSGVSPRTARRAVPGADSKRPALELWPPARRPPAEEEVGKWRGEEVAGTASCQDISTAGVDGMTYHSCSEGLEAYRPPTMRGTARGSRSEAADSVSTF